MSRCASVALLLLLASCSDDTPEPEGSIVEVSVNAAGVADDGRTLGLNLSTCRDGSVTVQETDAEVRVAAEGRETGPTEDCLGYPVQVELDDPLGDRMVVDTESAGTVHVARCEANPDPRSGCEHLFASDE